MKNITNSLYYSRTETEQTIIIEWKPFSTYSIYILLAIALIGIFSSVAQLSLGAFILLLANTVIYSTICRGVKNEINAASRNSCIQIKGNKFSFSSPLTVIIPKSDQPIEVIPETSRTEKNGRTIKKVFLGFLSALFLILGLLVFSAFTAGIRQAAYVGSLILLLVFALILFLMAFLCFRNSTK